MGQELQNHKSKCRLCFKSISGSRCSSQITEIVQQKFFDLTNIELKSSEKYSNSVCKTCIKSLEESSNFQQKMIDNQRQLYALEEDDNKLIVKAEPIELSAIELQEFGLYGFLPKTESFVEPWIEDQAMLSPKPEAVARSESPDDSNNFEDDESSSTDTENSLPKTRKTRKRRKKVENYFKRTNKNYTTEQLNRAVEAINTWQMTVLDAANHFQVPQSTLRMKMDRKPLAPQESDVSVTDEQEVQIRNFVKNRIESDLQTTNEDIINCASRVLWKKKKEHSPEMLALWTTWVEEFRERYAGFAETQPDEGFTHVCDLCNVTALKKKDLRSHMRFHGGKMRDNQNKAYSQAELDKAVRLLTEKSMPIKAVVKLFSIPRSTLAMKLSSYVKKPKRSEAKTAEEAHKCAYCEKVFFSLVSLNSHIRKHLEPEGEFTCEECGKVYLTLTRLKLHKVFHKRGVFKCGRCDMVFDLKKDVEKHRMSHQPLVACEVCGKMVTKGALYTSHMRTHGEPQFKCTFEGCTRKYYERKVLNLHMHSHTPNQNLNCSNCGKIFPNIRNLKRHERCHVEKLFPCQVNGCNHKSRRKEHMKLHLRNHRNIDVKLRDELIASIRKAK